MSLNQKLEHLNMYYFSGCSKEITNKSATKVTELHILSRYLDVKVQLKLSEYYAA